MGSLEPLPLFPLNTVLFPYARLQLHVYEPRYREMLRFCAENDSGFGIALIRSGQEVGGPSEPFMVGTAARIISAQTFEDGSSNVWVQGQQRFRIRQIDEEGNEVWKRYETTPGRARLGALQSRFETSIANLQVTSENLSASRSRILDADFAQETANLARAQILQQAGTAMVAQANQLPQQVLALLQR